MDPFSTFTDLIKLFWMQETMDDIDKNGDGHVDEDEYIGEFNTWLWSNSIKYNITQ